MHEIRSASWMNGSENDEHLFALFCFCAVSCCLHAQVVDATVCEILTSPQSFNGKIAA
jgi:hypothetical protein